MRKDEPTTISAKHQVGQFPGDLRDWFAGMALCHPYSQTDDCASNAGKTAAWAYEIADAMLAKRATR